MNKNETFGYSDYAELNDFSLLEEEDCFCQEIYSTCETLGRRKCSCNVLVRIQDALSLHKWDRVLSQKFLKIRHNFFADSFMFDNDVKIRSTDYSLKNLGIDSDLSPDIYLGEESGKHKFLEFFVTSSPEVALENKKQKYEIYREKISVTYVYFDMRLMMVFSDPELEFVSGYNLKRFEGMMKRTHKVDKFICYDSSELEIENITPGKTFEYVPQRIYYSPVYQEYRYDEYMRSLNGIISKLESYPEDSRCGVYFDCKSRKFSVKQGTRDPFWLMRAIRDPELFRDVISYENFDDECSILDETVLDFGETNLGEGHSLKIECSEEFHGCLEKAYSAEEIHGGIKELEFEGLYKKNISPEIIIDQADTFYKSWLKRCCDIKCPKVKMNTMLPIPDPDSIDKKLDRHKLIRFSKGWTRMAILKIPDLGSGISNFKSRDNNELNKEISERYLFCESCEERMKIIRKQISDLVGANEMSYRIMVIGERIKKMIRNSYGEDWSPDSIINSPELEGEFKLNSLEKEYFRVSIRRTKSMRKARRMMKSRVCRENMFTMDREMYSLYKQEIETFLRKRSKGEERMGLSGYSGEMRFEDVVELFDEFWKYCCQDSTIFTDWFDLNFTEISFPESVAGRQCKDYYSFYRICKEKIRKTRIYRIILWISNLARSIWAISTYKTKKRRVVFDKFGTKGCILFVCSTGNIQKYKSSKAFKVLIPICGEVEKFCGYGKIPGTEIIEFDDGTKYATTHWAYLKTQHLKYFMELPGKWLQSVICIMSEYGISKIESNLYEYITYCMMNARRKNENLLHDLKYMTYNMFGLKGCYSDLLEDKFEIPRDMLQRYIEEKFLREIPRFMKSLEQNQLLTVSPVGSYPSYRLTHPLSDSEYGLDSFNIFVYSSYCFPKGVFSHDIEQCVNMGSILDIHSRAMDILEGSKDYFSVKEKTDKGFEEIFNSDLYYNSGVVSAVGLFCEHYIASRGGNFDIRGSWSRIINSDITEYANSHGLRENDLSKSKSWGKKGHDVMTNYISRKCDIEKVAEFEKMNPQTLKDISKCKWEISLSKYRIIDYAKENIIENVELNNANKVQWGGSREIYIMTMGAKNIQWSLEQMFAKIAKSLDNEFIHVPASDRFGQLYNKIKNPVSGVRYYLTLDCRKWAPLSNLNKYLVFINSMSGILPKEFLEDFNYFFDIYYRKRLYFKSSDVEMFLKLNGNKKYSHFFVRSGDAYYIKMPYSFMMGMFNYLSSVLHSISQKYFESNIIPIIERETKSKIKFVMFAHSDDSGGYVEISDSCDPKSVLDQVLKEYEAFQKCLNHMFSLKKCTVGTSYFEITSYCFMKTDPMPVLPKFIFNHQINLTPSGYLSDVKSISSAVMEMVANGSSFRTAFIKYMILGNTYRKFCVGECLNDTDSRISLDLGGFPLIHPFYLVVYKSVGEKKWLGEFGSSVYGLNDQIMNAIGMIDPWGRRVGMKVRITSMKQRENDGRFRKFEIMPDLPDEIIPSGHFACYMRKMSSKYYSDTMWYSMHDIDGTIIQSNMFNNSLSQTYNVLGKNLSVPELISRVKCLIYSGEENSKSPSFNDYISDIDNNISLNESVNYRMSDSRAKPSEINTYYNKWWRGKTRETKIIALIKSCPWMAIMASSPIEYMDCLDSSREVPLSDVMANMLEEEPLIRFMMTTRAESRLMDRFDTISSWMFYNSYPNLQPIKLKRTEYRHSLPRQNFHTECISSIVFESVSSGRVTKPGDIQLVSEENGSKLITPAPEWLKTRSSEDPLFLIVRGTMPSSWMNKVDFISVKNNQYSQMGRYWFGRTMCVCRISGRSYNLSVKNGRIMKVFCKSRYTINSIREDMKIIDRFGFSFSATPSNHKTQRMTRITQNPSGDWVWEDELFGMPYYSNIEIDETIVTENRLIYEKTDSFESSIINKTEWARFRLKYKEGKNKYKAYILHKKPCEKCLGKCKYSGHDFCIGEKTNYSIKMTIEELINRWQETESYKGLHLEMIKYLSLFSERCTFMGQIGTYLSSSYIGSRISEEQNFFTNYKGELAFESSGEQSFPAELINEVKSHLSDYVTFRYRNGSIVADSNRNRIKELISEYGSAAISTAMVLLPVERTVNYYTPMLCDDYWYNNTQIMPEFMTNTLKYLSVTISKQSGMMSEKTNALKEIIQEIPDYLAFSYSRIVKYSYMASIPVNLKLFTLIKRFRDVGDPEDEEIDSRYYYDPNSIVKCIYGWLKYVLIYSNRRNGQLVPDYKSGYKREYHSFLKKYKSFCNECFQTTIKIRDLNSFKALSCPPYQIDMEAENRVYPLSECDFYDFTQDEEEFDDEYMTYDREESMLSFSYNEKERYDFSNESIFHNEGFIKSIRMCSMEECDNWVPLDENGILFRLSRNKGCFSKIIEIRSVNYGASLDRMTDREISKLMIKSKSEDEKTLMETMLDQLRDEDREKIISENPLRFRNKYYHSKMSIINAMFAKFAIFTHVFDESGDITPILERSSYDSITNLSRPLNDSFFNQISKAEMSLLSPGIVEDMETNCFRLTNNQHSQIKTIKRATKFKNKAIEYTVERLIASAVVSETQDMLCEQTSERLFKILKLCGHQVDLTKDEQYPDHREGEYTLPYTMTIGV